MIQLPKRNSLVHETVITLKQWIASGRLQEVLPGELDLKERLRIGRDTLRLALQLLTKEGWVEPSVKGRKRRIQAKEFPTSKKQSVTDLPVTFVSPYAVEQAQALVDIEETQKQLMELGRSLQFVSPDIFHLKHPEHHLENLVRTHPSAAWVLYSATDPMQRWFASKELPTILCGRPYPEVDLPYVAKDWEPAGFHVGLQFIRHGHRNIGMFEYVQRGVGAMAIERGLRRALDKAANGAKLLMFKDERTPESIAKSYDAAFKLKERPTAMVLTSSEHLLTSMSWMISKGIRVPGDVSLATMPYDSWYAELYPPLCHYKPNTKAISHGIAERVLDLIEHGRVLRKSIEVPLEFVAGATIGPAPAIH